MNSVLGRKRNEAAVAYLKYDSSSRVRSKIFTSADFTIGQTANITEGFIALMREAASISDTSVYFCKTTQHHIPKAGIFILAAIRT
jgi:hypothetical protein